VFRECIYALADEPLTITAANFSGLSLLCTEFGFEGLMSRLSAFRSSAAFAGETADTEARTWIAELEERSLARDRDVAALQAELGRLSAAVASLRGAAGGGGAAALALGGDPGRIEAAAAVEGGGPRGAIEELRAEILALRARRLRFADRRGLSGALRGVRREAL
jgi:hypothetical protein